MEQELFCWKGWDGDQECMSFYNVELKQAIGEFSAGTQFSGAQISFVPEELNYGILQFYNEGKELEGGVTEIDVVAEFKLHYRVGDRIK